jgi:hypothetical protein
MFDRIRQWRDRARTVAEVAAMSDRDLADLGLGRDQAMTLAAAPADTVDRMERMAAIFGVDAQVLHADHEVQMALAEACCGCGDRAACGAALALDFALPGAVSADDCGFCPNARDFALLRAPG